MVGVKANDAPELSSASQPNVPPDHVRTLFEVQVVRPAPLKSAVKRFDDEAVVEKKFVEVALVEVELRAVKFCSVVEPTTRRSPDELMVEVAVPPIASALPVRMPLKKELVLVPLVDVKLPRVQPVTVRLSSRVGEAQVPPSSP